ncbi:MAG: hypothetical protein HY270_19845 [Deltaproteobacteria bacterium]|nr:hypothetical protein [Deltaproteobacteria bacterium]
MLAGIRRRVRLGLRLAFGLALAGPARPALASFTAFESGPVRPVVLSPSHSKLLAVNTPDNQLEIFDIAADGSLARNSSVTVGLEPVAIGARSDSEVWVVNHLSDSVSIVDVASTPPHVVRTLLVGDEPRDIVFAGPSGDRAFIACAHRGQNSNVDPADYTNPGLCNGGANVGLTCVQDSDCPSSTCRKIGRADIWVFDATNIDNSLAGNPLTVINLFGDTPRALAVNASGTTVYAAVFESGNQTTAINEGAVCDGGAMAGPCNVLGNNAPGGLPAPNVNVQNVAQPETGLIVKYNNGSGHWEDTLNRSWDEMVKFSLPDRDVFAIDATANPPAQTSSFAHVGTVLFNMAVNPVSGKVYVTNTDANNKTRFEGPGVLSGSTVRGHLAESRITVLDGASVSFRHLNKHIDYSVIPSPKSIRSKSLATPTGMAISANGATLYVAAFGSSKVGIFDTAQIEADSFTPSTAKQIVIPGGGPAGLALLEPLNRLYVSTRFDNGISVIDTAKKREVQHVSLNNPEPYSLVKGRPFLYDAFNTSSNGEAACASCHIFGDFDSLAWDLGNPDDVVLNNPNPFRLGPLGDPSFHPMKGPMTTQTLRGMANHGPMHWRGDRTGGNDIGGSALDSNAAFLKFNVAFGGLLGRVGPLTDADMQAFADFILQVIPPPNPIRRLNNSLTNAQQNGRNFYFNNTVDGGILTCNSCHVLDPANGHFGTDGQSSFENETQHFKIAHLRNAYTKVGMFGFPGVAFIGGAATGDMGEQVRGFGFLHDGSIDTAFHFFHATVFTFGNDNQRRNVEQFVLAYDSNLAPIVGQQTTLTATSANGVANRIDLLIARAAAGECDLVVKGNVAAEARGWYRTAAGDFQPDRSAEATIADASLRALAATVGQELTYTCVPPGSGVRVGVDHDGDGVFDGDERDAGTDPGSAWSVPTASITCSGGSVLSSPKLRITKNVLPTGDERLTLKGEWVVSSLVPAIDPVANGFRFRVNDKDGIPLFNRVVPRGTKVKKGAPGWSVNKAGTVWTFTDRSGTAAGGITRVVVRNKSATAPGLFSVSVSSQAQNFYFDPAVLPAQLLVVLGGPEQSVAGQCATLAFNGSAGPDPRCAVSVSGMTLTCD